MIGCGQRSLINGKVMNSMRAFCKQAKQAESELTTGLHVMAYEWACPVWAK